ncbi:hypothetical protein BD410DRAFT_181988 [Rickenella mellea]|uniref:F-box domain-containing protein n=1 Tax=Rickenella mellea TaxID=50990 RepID=A0A4Y7PH13_9AGAM|nr:hypothetical protein BD410DRAFT_181988 [Rickenella mellea]
MTTDLPTEVLRVIIRLATYSDIDFDNGFIHGLDMDWFVTFRRRNAKTMETKFALLTISHRIMQIAAEFLYEIIVVTDKPFLLCYENLAAKLERSSTPAALTHLVPCRREWVKFIFAYESSQLTTAPTVAAILRFCPELKGFSWINQRSRWTPYLLSSSRTRFEEEQMIEKIPNGITIFNWHADVHRVALASVFRGSSASLRVLYIGGLRNYSPSNNAFPQVQHIPEIFPSLSDLKIMASVNLFDTLEMWSIPALADLYLEEDFGDDRLCDIVLPKVARTLRILRFGVRIHVTTELLSKTIHVCQCLQELHYCDLDVVVSPWTSRLTHPSLKYVEVSYDMFEFEDMEQANSSLLRDFGCLSNDRFPLLDTIVASDVFINSSERMGCRIMLQRVSGNFSAAGIRVL